MYQKWATFLRIEVLSNRLKDFGLNKGLENLDAVRQKLAAVADRFAAFEAESLHTPIDFPLFQRLALPIQLGRSRVPGIKIHDTRVLRLLEVLLHGGTQITGWRSRQMHEAVLEAYGLTEQTYTLGQTALRSAQIESSRAGRTSRPQLLLSPHPQRHPGSGDVLAFPQTCLRPVGPQLIRDGPRRDVKTPQ